MKKVLYISNIEVPYRSEFFNQLSEKVELTVLYERKKSSNRNKQWVESIKPKYKTKYLKGIKFKNEYTFDLSILRYVFAKEYNKIILGCYNSPSQIIAILIMKLFRKKYILNIDGEYFIDGNSFKKKIKRFLIKGADEYLVAGEKSADSLSKYICKDKIHPYYFSSLTKEELKNNAKHMNNNTNNFVLVVGQYFDYKGLDTALEVALHNNSIKYKFIGSGNRSEILKEKVDKMGLENVEIIPFLQKDKLYKEYQSCKMLLLPSIQECWGLVVNEAASFGCPIVSTDGCGAILEFYDDKYKKYIGEAGNADSLYRLVKKFYELKNIDTIKNDLINKSSRYYIEKNVKIYAEVIKK